MLPTLLIFALHLSSLLWASPVSVDNGISNKELRIIKSKETLKYMNITADPCEDFNNFACGNWKKHHPVNRTIIQTRYFAMAQEEFNRQISEMLNATDNAADTETERKVKNFYKSCLNLGSLRFADIKKDLHDIIEEFGEMPLLKGPDWCEEDFDWLKTVAEISYKYGFNIIIGPTILADWHDRSSNLLVIDSQEFLVKLLGASREFYQAIVVNALVKFFSVKRKEAPRLAQEIVDFEFLLYKGKNLKDAILNKTNMQDLHNKYFPHLDVMKMMNISYGLIPSGVVAVMSTSYIQDVIDALQTTPKRVVANYIFFHLIMEFKQVLPQTKALKRDCIALVQKFFPKIIIAMFYDDDDSKDLVNSQQQLEDMWQTVKSVAKELLDSDDFGGFDEATREDILEKVHSIRMVMPLYKRNSFDVEYQHLNIDKLDYIENFKSLKTFKAQRQRASLEEKPNFVEMGLKLYTPSYIAKGNTLLFPPTILTKDFYWSKSLSKAFNYARLGFLVSHELVHSFTGIGSFYNKFGKIADNIYDEIENDIERRSCLSEQYHNISYGGKPLPQDNLQTENVADNVGLAIAVEAYRRWLTDTGRTPQDLELETLPLLNYTSQQLFFVHYSQMWCSETLEELRAHTAAADKHSPDDIRTYMPLRNLDAFSKEFNCSEGSRMNTADTCALL